MVHVKVATKNTPEYAFEGGQTSPVNGTSDESDMVSTKPSMLSSVAYVLKVELYIRGRKLVLTIFVLQQRCSSVIE